MKWSFKILFVFLPIITYSQLSEKVNELYLQLNTEKRIESQNIGYSGKESEIYLKYIELAKIASDKEVLFMAEHGEPVVKAYMSMVLVDRKSDKLIDLFKNYLSNNEEIWIQMGCTGYNSSIAGALYSSIF